MTKIAGSGSESGSISQRHGSADPDPSQNVMDPQHCFKEFNCTTKYSLVAEYESLVIIYGAVPFDTPLIQEPYPPGAVT
jgi:hypothetical protein